MSLGAEEWKLVNEGSEVKLNAKSQWMLDYWYQHGHPPNGIKYRDEWYPLLTVVSAEEGTRLYDVWRNEYVSNMNHLFYRPGKLPLGKLLEYTLQINAITKQLVEQCGEDATKFDSTIEKLKKLSCK